MSTKKQFTPEEIRHLRANPYTRCVTADTISYTLAFKEAFWALSLQGYTGPAAFRKLGYNTEVLGFERVHNTTKRIRREAKSLECQTDAAGDPVPPAADGVLKKSHAAARQAGTVVMDSAGERFAAIQEALADRKNILTVKELCELAGVSRSGYYNWVRSERARETREQRDRADFEWILEAYRFRSYAKGARGIHMRLLHMGVRMNVKKIRRLMRKYRLTCPIRKPNPYRRLQRSIRMGSTAENLVNREFESRGPRAILLTDITYIPLNGKFCYLSTILDACTKQVLSYAVSESLEVDFVLEMVERLVQNYGTSLNKETVIHSDQGTHYTSLKFIQLVESRELRRSMSRRGNCWDNAPQESFFGHMKDELAGEIPGWTSFADAKASIDRWMDYYNQDRCQWDLAKLSPNEFYEYISTGEHPAGMLPQWVK